MKLKNTWVCTKCNAHIKYIGGARLEKPKLCECGCKIFK